MHDHKHNLGGKSWVTAPILSNLTWSRKKQARYGPHLESHLPRTQSLSLISN